MMPSKVSALHRARVVVLVGAVLALVGAVASVAAWMGPTLLAEQARRRALEALRARGPALFAAVPRRWSVPSGVAPVSEGNLVPTTWEVRALRRELGYADKSPRGTGRPSLESSRGWLEWGEPSPPLVEKLRGSAGLRAAVGRLAEGDFGADTGASCEELEEALLFLSARAHAAPAGECVDAFFDALRVARAVQPLPRACNGPELPHEGWMLGSVTEPAVRCSRAVGDETRLAMIRALERFDAAAWPLAPRYVVDHWWRAVQRSDGWDVEALEEDADWIEARLRVGPGELWRIPMDDRRFPTGLASRLQLDTYAHRQSLLAVMRIHAALPPFPAGHPHRERFTVREDMVTTTLIQACETPLDGAVPFDVE